MFNSQHQMYKRQLILFFSFFYGVSFSQEVQQFQINIHRYNDSVRIESCIPLDLYNERIVLPGDVNENKRGIQGIPMHVIGSKWADNCLIIQWPNIPNNDIVQYILEFTTLREDQIIIIE